MESDSTPLINIPGDLAGDTYFRAKTKRNADTIKIEEISATNIISVNELMTEENEIILSFTDNLTNKKWLGGVIKINDSLFYTTDNYNKNDQLILKNVEIINSIQLVGMDNQGDNYFVKNKNANRFEFKINSIGPHNIDYWYGFIQKRNMLILLDTTFKVEGVYKSTEKKDSIFKYANSE